LLKQIKQILVAAEEIKELQNEESYLPFWHPGSSSFLSYPGQHSWILMEVVILPFKARLNKLTQYDSILWSNSWY